MHEVETRPYGSWPSPITTDLIVADAVRLNELRLDGERVYWIELRPAEGGRCVICSRDAGGQRTDIIPEGFSARTRAHEYGGGAFTVHDNTVYFSNDPDQRVYRQAPDGQPQPISPEGPFRFADFAVDSARQRLLAVLEDHGRGDAEPANKIVALSLGAPPQMSELLSGSDFYSNPQLSRDGRQLAWLQWQHPNMPWDETELWLADLDEQGAISGSRRVAGGDGESVFQPQWSPAGELVFISDRTGWWNLYRYRSEHIEPIWPLQAEFGLPQWVFGMSTYAFAARNRLVCAFFEGGQWKLGVADLATGARQVLELPFSHFEQIRAEGNLAVFIAASPICPNAAFELDLDTGKFEVVRRSAEIPFESTYLSRPEAIEYPTSGGETAHAYFYPPQNLDCVGPSGELPPLIVKSHGGPTAAATTALDLRIQFWTSRGFAVLDVDYRGSTGYGRAYRERLYEQWGIVDVDDCVAGARYLVQRGLVDEQRLAIAGGSAGGYTTLCTLTFRDYFKAGASYYGVSDLEALAKETHKFESRYLDRLVGPYPERRDIYVERSPIHYADRISCPVILMQGTEDRVVPPNQAMMLVEALRAKRLPVAYVVFEGEQHGFRKADSIKRALEAELYFYGRVFGFEPADDIEPVEIENL